MPILKPDRDQPKPDQREVRDAVSQLRLIPIQLKFDSLNHLLSRLRENHSNGGAYLVAFDVEPDRVFEWYASRNRLWENEVLDRLLENPSVIEALPDLLIPSALGSAKGFGMEDPFVLDGIFANLLFQGGAYTRQQGDGKEEKSLALEVCEIMFSQRFGEISLAVSHHPWTPWFKDIAWDLTAIIFDLRLRRLWIFAITDTD